MEKKLILTDDLFLGKGHHKVAYKHPNDEDKCVKVAFMEPDIDEVRELAYRKTRQRRHLDSSILPQYYGIVETNKGLGYVYEMVHDFDGKLSQTLYEYMENSPHTRESNQHIIEELKAFHQEWLQEEILITTGDPTNFLVQRVDKTHNHFRIIDNIGTHEHIPVSSYISYFAHKKIDRYWKRILRALQAKNPDILTDSIVEDLMKS